MTVEYEQVKTRWAVTRFELVLGWARAGVEPTAEDHLPSSAARTAARDRRKYTSSPGIESKVNSDHDESTVLDRISTLGVDFVEEGAKARSARPVPAFSSVNSSLVIAQLPPQRCHKVVRSVSVKRGASGPFLRLAA
jgi:hypothetical protein